MSDCDAIALHFAEGGDTVPASYDPHLRSCSHCQRLAHFDRALEQPGRSVVMSEALSAALDRDLRPVRFRPAWERALLPLGAVAAVTLSGATLLGRHPRGLLERGVVSFALVVMAAAGVGVLTWRGPSGLGVPVRWRRGYLAGSFALFALSLLTHAQPPSHPLHDATTLAHMGVSAINAVADPHHEALGPMQNIGACASSASVFAAVVALAALWSARRTVPVSSGSMGAVVGASAGLAAVAALEPACAASTTHALAAHGLPMVVATVLCTFLGRRSLAP